MQYEAVIDQPFNAYTEQSLVRITQALLQKEEKDKAFLFWKKLEELAQFDENKRYAQFNLMQYYFQTKQYTDAIAYAESILALNNIEEQIKWDAYYILAKAAEAIKDITKMTAAFKALEKAPKGEWSVEALFYDAKKKHKQLEFAASNTVIENIAQNYGGYPEWGARSLLLMSKNFYQLDDAFQATYILESILENFTQFPDLIKEAKADLENIKMVEAKNNDSINLENDSNE